MSQKPRKVGLRGVKNQKDFPEEHAPVLPRSRKSVSIYSRSALELSHASK